MAHFQQLKFVETTKSIFPDYFSNKKILEIGSWSAFGSVRDFFTECQYTGADVLPGPGVDIVCPGQDLTLPDSSFDTCISCECFEHNPFWQQTFMNMVRMLRSGGLCVVTCATTGRKEHGTKRSSPGASLTTDITNTEDYYMNLTSHDFTENIDLRQYFQDFRFFKNMYSKDLYFVGVKRGQAMVPNISEKLDKLMLAAESITTKAGASPGRRRLQKLISAAQDWFIPLIGDRTYRNAQHVFRSVLKF